MRKQLLLSDYYGLKYGRLTVVDLFDGKYQKELLCVCDCGNMHSVTLWKLKNGKVKSCGCYNSDLVKARCLTHGQSGRTVEYKAWIEMKYRCYNPNCIEYNNYGGRGIKVCDRWVNSFENFFEDMGLKPSKLHSLDRYPDKNGDYGPTNCRWATMMEQQNNRTNNNIITIDGVSRTLAEWSRVSGLNMKLISERIIRGWEPKNAVFAPVQKTRRKGVAVY